MTNIATLPQRKQAQPVRVGLMNPDFVYVPASKTDIRVRFEAIRAAMQKQEKKVRK